MYKYILTVVVIALFCYGISFGQTSCDEEIFVADEDDLPYSGSSYTPCASSFSYVFEFDVLRYSGPTNNVTISPQVVTSQLNLTVNSIRYTPGTDYTKTGDSFTGSGSDYLAIGIISGELSDAFANMDWSVHYYNDNPD